MADKQKYDRRKSSENVYIYIYINMGKEIKNKRGQVKPEIYLELHMNVRSLV